MVSEDQKNVFNIQGPTYLAIYIRCEAEALFSTGAGLACTTRIILIISTYYLIPCLNYMYLNTERKSGVIHVEERLNNFTVCLKSVPVVVLISGVVGGGSHSCQFMPMATEFLLDGQKKLYMFTIINKVPE